MDDLAHQGGYPLRAMSHASRALIEFISRSAPSADDVAATSFALNLAQRISTSLHRDTAQAVHRRLARFVAPPGLAHDG
eukprot:4992831-Amphidinium_carterae.1